MLNLCEIFLFFFQVLAYPLKKLFFYDFLHTNKKGKIFNNLNEAYNQFSKILHNNDILMVKGSNATGLNKFSKNIKRGQLSVI